MLGVATRNAGTGQGQFQNQADGHGGKHTEPKVGGCVSSWHGHQQLPGLGTGVCASSVDSVTSEFIRLNSFKVNI